MSSSNEEDFPIYRIMSIYEFYELYVNHKLKLTLCAKQEDKDDGIELLFKEFIFDKIFLLNKLKKEEAKKRLISIRKNNYITCWTQENDSVAIWSVYSKNLESIRVKTTKKKLQNCLISFIQDNAYDSQWERPDQNFVTKLNVPIDVIQHAQYTDIRSVLNKAKQEFTDTYQGRSVETREELNRFLAKIVQFNKNLNNEYSYLYDSFIKDESFYYEKEIRGKVSVGLNMISEYPTYEDWQARSCGTESYPIKDNEDILPDVIYAKTDNDFIEEVCFDSRMPKYKRDTIIEMMKVNLNKVIESKCFNPAINEIFS